MSHSSNHFAIAMVVLAGIMWAGSGVGAQNFFEKCSMNAMELTAFRMMASRMYPDRGDDMAGQDEKKPQAPSKEAAAVDRYCDLRHCGPHADALYLFRGDRVWQCRYGDCRALQLSCHGHLLQCHPLSQAAIERGGHHGLSGCRRHLSSCDRRRSFEAQRFLSLHSTCVIQWGGLFLRFDLPEAHLSSGG